MDEKQKIDALAEALEEALGIINYSDTTYVHQEGLWSHEKRMEWEKLLREVKEQDNTASTSDVLDEIRGWLEAGATIRATDRETPVLKSLPDGSWYGGLYVDFSGSWKD